MGYMGFGMQSWVYRMKPRKPFQIERKASFSALPKYSREFKIKPRSYSEKPLVKFLIIITTTIFLSVIFLYLQSAFQAHNKEISISTSERIKRENKDVFDFLYKSGMYRLNEGKFEEAYSEFELAYKLSPYNPNVLKLLIETSYTLCEDGHLDYCERLTFWLEHTQ